MNKLKETLQKDLNYISQRIENGYNNDNIIAQNIDFLLSIADDQHIRLKENNTINNYIDNYEEDEECASKDFIDNYHEYKEFNVALTKIGEKLSEEYGFKLTDPKLKGKLSMEESIKIVGRFFKTYDKDLYDYFENFIINGKFFIVKKVFENYGLSSISDELLEPYLFIQETKTLRDINVLAHETIHIYLSEKQKYMTEKEYSNIYINGTNEIYSHYIEYILLDFLESNNYNKKDIINYKKSLYYDLISHLSNFYIMLEPTDIDFTNYDEVSMYTEMREYSYGLYFLYHFYEQYILDANMAKYNITNFMLDSSKKDFNYLINNYGLDEEKLKDYKVLLRHIEKIY